MASAQVPAWLTTILEEYSTDRFHVEFKGFIYNHFHQGAIALWRLGASEERVRQFAEFYSKDLENARDVQQVEGQAHALLASDKLQDLLGKRQGFLPLVAHFQQRLNDLGGDLDQLVNSEFPALASGLASKVLHGVIEIGYGYSIGDGRIIAEGLAYMHFSTMPQVLTTTNTLSAMFGQGQKDFINAIMDVRQNKRLMSYLEDKVIFGDNRDFNPYLVKMQTLLTHRGDDLVEAVATIKMPDWFDKDNLDREQLKKLGHWMLDAAILLYISPARRNNNYFLHGVTGGWGLSHIMPTLKNGNNIMQTFAYFMSTLVAMYISEGCPDLSEDHFSDIRVKEWQDLKSLALESDFDEHVFKVMHVCHTRYEEGGELGERYVKAATIALEYPITRAAMFTTQ